MYISSTRRDDIHIYIHIHIHIPIMITPHRPHVMIKCVPSSSSHSLARHHLSQTLTTDTQSMEEQSLAQHHTNALCNIDTDSSLSTATTSRSTSPFISGSPAASWERKLMQRQKQIDYGKNTIGYDRYRRLVPREKRRKHDPKTPDKYQECSTRSWVGQIKQWRRRLHLWDPPSAEQKSSSSSSSSRTKSRHGPPHSNPHTRTNTDSTVTSNNRRQSRSEQTSLRTTPVNVPDDSSHTTEVESIRSADEGYSTNSANTMEFREEIGLDDMDYELEEQDLSSFNQQKTNQQAWHGLRERNVRSQVGSRKSAFAKLQDELSLSDVENQHDSYGLAGYKSGKMDKNNDSALEVRVEDVVKRAASAFLNQGREISIYDDDFDEVMDAVV